MKNKIYNKFTLVELLVVICIASLLMGLVLPAFSRMVTGSAVDRLASNLKLRLERAQSHAFSSRRHVALILPHGGASWRGKAADARHGGSRMCYVTWDSVNNQAVFDGWVVDEDWAMPEHGAFLINAVTYNDTELATTPSNSSTNALDQFGVEGKWQYLGTSKTNDEKAYNNGGRSVAVTEFDSGGVPYSGNRALQIVDGLDADPPGPDTASASVNPMNCAIVFSPNGGIRTRNLSNIYLVVAEAFEEGGHFRFPNGGAYNFRILEIDRLTGIVGYYTR